MDQKKKTIANKKIIENAEKATIKKLVVLMDSDDTDMEEFIKNCKMEWTILRPVEFMKNVFFQWAETIKIHNSVFTAFPDTPSARIHEMDVADVATKVLLEEGHQVWVLVMITFNTLLLKWVKTHRLIPIL